MTVALGGGWFVGWAVGALVVVIAAALLLTVIALGRRIARQAEDITRSLAGTNERTTPLFELGRTNHALDRIARGLRERRGG